MLRVAASCTEGVLRQPEPEVFETALTSFSIEYELVAYATSDVPRPVIMSRLHEQILDVFNEHDVQIMTPHFEDQPEQTVVVPRANWFAGPAAPESGPSLRGGAGQGAAT